MPDTKIYGSSLYYLAKDDGITDIIFSELKEITKLFKENPDYVKILNSHQIEQDELINILNEDFRDNVNVYTLNFIKILSEKHIVHHIDECLKAYEKLYNIDNNIKIVKVITAKPISSIIEEKLIKKLSEKTGSKIVLRKLIDENCIGGIIIKMDGMIIDSSVKTSLLYLKKTLI